MAAATATMDDLIAGLSGGMHVSQDGHDLKALQEYLAQNLPLPLPPPGAGYAYPIGSRSTSMTRKPTSLPSYTYPSPTPVSHALPLQQSQLSQPVLSSSFEQPSQIAHAPAQRPAPPRRASSFGTVPHSYTPNATTIQGSPQASYASFESDAFAPVWQQQMRRDVSEDPWARMRSAPTGAFGFPASGHMGVQAEMRATDERPGAQWGLQLGGCGQGNHKQGMVQAEDDDMAMDEDNEMGEDDQVEMMMAYEEEQMNEPWRQGRQGRQQW